MDDWAPTGYIVFDVVFGTLYFSPDYTLGEAIRQGGGGVNLVARLGTAALLSAAHPDVDATFTVEHAIGIVQIGLIDPLAPLLQPNEQGCSIPK